jgi:hypothetical protein
MIGAIKDDICIQKRNKNFYSSTVVWIEISAIYPTRGFDIIIIVVVLGCAKNTSQRNANHVEKAQVMWKEGKANKSLPFRYKKPSHLCFCTHCNKFEGKPFSKVWPQSEIIKVIILMT